VARTAIFLNPGADLAPAIALARRADSLGYESLWVTHGIGRDALLTLSAYGHVAPHAGLGTGVIPIYPRHPALLAQEALTLSDTSGGRLRLGIGVSHKSMMTDALGLDMARPLEVTREYVTVLRGAGCPSCPRRPRFCWAGSPRACSSWRGRSPTAQCSG
jgi:5,10-methylenetetrahydromethanopterin reductase